MFNFSDKFQEFRSNMVGVVLLLGCTIMGSVWIGVGLSRLLSAYLGEIWGPIVLGLLCFVPVVIFALVKAFSRDSAPAPARVNLGEFGEPSIASMAGLFEKVSGQSPLLGVVAAVAAAFIIKRFPGILPLFAQLLTAYMDDINMRAAKAAAAKNDGAAAPPH